MKAQTRRKMQAKDKLFLFRCLALVVYIAAIVFLIAGKFPYAVILFVMGNILDRTLYRCPHCHKQLDILLNVTSKTVCRKCGNVINDPIKEEA